MLKIPEATYIGLGYLLEKARHPARVNQLKNDIKRNISTENEDDRQEAHRLVERGKQEARTGR